MTAPLSGLLRELAMRTKMSVKMAELQVDILVDRGLMTSNLLPTWTPTTAGNFFTLPDEVFYLNLTLDTYTHVTGDMHRNAAEIVGNVVTEWLGDELTLWQNEGNGATAAST